jgi:hypothetical protein
MSVTTSSSRVHAQFSLRLVEDLPQAALEQREGPRDRRAQVELQGAALAAGFHATGTAIGCVVRERDVLAGDPKGS